MYNHHSTWQLPVHKAANGSSFSTGCFQNQSDQIFGDILNVYCIADGILIAVPSQKEHGAAIQKIS